MGHIKGNACKRAPHAAYNDKHIQLQIQKPPKQGHTTTHDRSKNKHKAYKDINSNQWNEVLIEMEQIWLFEGFQMVLSFTGRKS